jgi:hypothetical protein
MQPLISGSGTWTIYPTTQVDTDTPLTPFTSADGQTLNTFTTARYTSTFGYKYLEIQVWLPQTPAELAANVTAVVQTLYNPDGRWGIWPSCMYVHGSSLAANTTVRAWSVVLEVPNGALGEGFSVAVSVRAVSLGKMFILSAPTQVEISAGVNQVTKSELTLVGALNGVDTEDVDAALALLKERLTWKVVKIVTITFVND